jgi:hypothetical protein
MYAAATSDNQVSGARQDPNRSRRDVGPGFSGLSELSRFAGVLVTSGALEEGHGHGFRFQVRWGRLGSLRLVET